MKHNVWTDEAIERFFSYRNSHNPQYFSEVAGRKVLKYVSPQLHGVKDVLDYGCGLGYMSGYLMEAGYRTTAMDFTHSSVDEVNKKFSGNENWNGGFYYSDLLSHVTGGGGGYKNKFDAIFIIEVIEHLSDYYLDELMKNLKILCKKGGYLVITTPNQENLQKHMLYCPFCDTEFNNSQHVRSWSTGTLTQLLNSHNFSVPFISEVTLADLYSPDLRRRKIKMLIRKILHGLHLPVQVIQEPEVKPNLVCVAQYNG